MMKEINQHEQESKYGMIQQAERVHQLIQSEIQFLANEAVGVTKIT